MTIVVSYAQGEWLEDPLDTLLDKALDKCSLHEEDEMARQSITIHIQVHAVGSTESDCKTAFPT